jgi:hypothetical protein
MQRANHTSICRPATNCAAEGESEAMKTQVVERLGEKVVLLPSVLGDALAATDCIKLGLSLLQEAAAHAQAPQPRAARGGDVVAGAPLVRTPPGLDCLP